jgi:hypothetical protein
MKNLRESVGSAAAVASMGPVAIEARRLVRKMRGGAQAHLIEGDDEQFYVVKFRNNPLHRRILVNEWIASALLRFLHIDVPATAIMNFSGRFLEENPDAFVQLRSRRVAAEQGPHFASAYPGDPHRTAVYDFIPDVLLGKVVNLSDFLGVLVFDKWACNTDARQSLFLRTSTKQEADEEHAPIKRSAFKAIMLDHGYVFGGPDWTFADSPLQGLYFRQVVYRNVRSLDDFQPWLDRVVNFPDEVVEGVLKQLPPEWLENDQRALEGLVDRLMRRRNRVPDLIQDATRGCLNVFPVWN